MLLTSRSRRFFGTAVPMTNRLSTLFAPPLHLPSSDIVSSSQRFLLQAGFVRILSPGLSMMLPLALRVLGKIERIIDDELQARGCARLSMPILIPAQLWQQTGRWEKAGPELFRLKDRKDGDFCLGSTHEEVFTQLVAQTARSPKSLPLRLYQIGPKFRDEIRLRAGLLRGREFLMKDLYSFDLTPADALKTYEDISQAYEKIFQRVGVPFTKVEADSGAIGGNKSHEFHLTAPVGEDTLLLCDSCSYAANVEKATARPSPLKSTPQPTSTTPIPESMLAVLPEMLGNAVKQGVAVLHLVLPSVSDGTAPPVLALLRPNHTLNPIAIKTVLGSPQIDYEIPNPYNLKGFLATSNPYATCKVLVDDSVLPAPPPSTSSWLSGCLHVVQPGEGCPACATGVLRQQRGIEVGHVFYLGTRYSKPMNAEVQGVPLAMGCYGIGVSRLMAAVAEATLDEKGLCWPESIAPFNVLILPIGKAGSSQHEAAVQTYHALSSYSEVLLDDEHENPGSRLKRAELIGIPWVLVIGRDLPQGKAELTYRKSGAKTLINLPKAGDNNQIFRAEVERGQQELRAKSH